MTPTPEMPALVHRLLACEAVAGGTAAPSESVPLRVYEKLRQGLVEFAGTAGFQSLASCALALARTEAPILRTARIAADGTLQGLADSEPAMHLDQDPADEAPAEEAATIFIARLLSLLFVFIGEALTLRLLRLIWPGNALDDRDSENRENL